MHLTDNKTWVKVTSFNHKLNCILGDVMLCINFVLREEIILYVCDRDNLNLVNLLVLLLIRIK